MQRKKDEKYLHRAYSSASVSLLTRSRVLAPPPGLASFIAICHAAFSCPLRRGGHVAVPIRRNGKISLRRGRATIAFPVGGLARHPSTQQGPVAVGRSESRRIGVPERLGAGHERDMSGFLGSTRAPLRWVRRVTGISMRFSLRCGLGGRSNGSIAANVVILLHRGTRPCLVSPGYISRCPDGPPLPLMDISELVQLVGPRAVAGTFGAIMNCLLGAVGCRLPPHAR